MSLASYHRRTTRAKNRSINAKYSATWTSASADDRYARLTNLLVQRAILITLAITGDVYELTVEDARKVATSDQIAGQILLTDTYGRNTKSFITIPISEELTREFIIQRQRVM